MNKHSCLLSWVNSLDDGSKRTYVIHQISGENATPSKDKTLFSCEEFCRICHCGAEDEKLISPCRCSGSAKYAHQSCLLSWFELKKDKICELCLYEMNVKKTGFKPLAQVCYQTRVIISRSDLYCSYLFGLLICPELCPMACLLAYLTANTPLTLSNCPTGDYLTDWLDARLNSLNRSMCNCFPV